VGFGGVWVSPNIGEKGGVVVGGTLGVKGCVRGGKWLLQSVESRHRKGVRWRRPVVKWERSRKRVQVGDSPGRNVPKNEWEKSFLERKETLFLSKHN